MCPAPSARAPIPTSVTDTRSKIAVVRLTARRRAASSATAGASSGWNGAAAPRRVPRGELGRAGSRREALDRAADLDDGHARAGRGELPLDRGQRLAPGDAEHVVLAQETRQERSGGDRHVVDDERRRETVALLERTREAVVDASGLGDLEADDAFRPRLLQETHDLEPRHAEALGDVLLGQIADVVEPGDLGHLRSAHSCILLHR